MTWISGWAFNHSRACRPPVREHVDGLVCREIDDDCGVGLSLLDREIVDTHGCDLADRLVGQARSSRNSMFRLADSPSAPANRAPARPASATLIEVSIARDSGVLRACRVASPAGCSVKVRTTHSVLSQKNRRTRSAAPQSGPRSPRRPACGRSGCAPASRAGRTRGRLPAAPSSSPTSARQRPSARLARSPHAQVRKQHVKRMIVTPRR